MKKREERTLYYYVALYSGLGFTMVIFTILCMYVGIYIDRLLNTGYNFSLLMTIFGMGVGGWWTYRRVIKNALQDDNEGYKSKVSRKNVEKNGRKTQKN